MALGLIVVVLIGLTLLALFVHGGGRIVIVWGELGPPVHDGGFSGLRVSQPALSLSAPTPWEMELRRRLRQRVAALPQPAPMLRSPRLQAAPLADGCYLLLAPLRAAQE